MTDRNRRPKQSIEKNNITLKGFSPEENPLYKCPSVIKSSQEARNMGTYFYKGREGGMGGKRDGRGGKGRKGGEGRE